MRTAWIRPASLALFVGSAFLVVALSGSLSELGTAGPLLFIPLSACLTAALFPGPLLSAASGLLTMPPG